MNTGDPRCAHKVCNRHARSNEPWHCYFVPPPRPDPKMVTSWTYTCRCGTRTQGGTAGLLAHQDVVGCPKFDYLPLDFVVTRKRT